MKTEIIGYAHATVGREVTVWYVPGYCGQGGVVTRNDTEGIEILAPGDRPFFWSWLEVDRIEAHVPFDADECLDYGPDGSECSGPVDWWHSGGMNGRSWPRCERHGRARLERHEDSIERYADSDVEPDWFDPTYAGERWDDD